MKLLHRLSPVDGARIARELMPKSKIGQKAVYIKILAQENDPSVREHCKEMIKEESWSGRIGAIEAWSILVSKHGADDALDMLKLAAVEQDPWWMRMMVARAMRKITPTEDLNAFYKERSEAEEKPQGQAQKGQEDEGQAQDHRHEEAQKAVAKTQGAAKDEPQGVAQGGEEIASRPKEEEGAHQGEGESPPGEEAE